MSKKRRRYERSHKKKHNGNPKVFNTHHLCFIRRRWGNGYARAVRQFHYCQVELEKDRLHKYIHEQMSEVPIPRDIAAKNVYEQLILLDRQGVLHDNDPIEKRLMLLIALFDCIAQPTADGFRHQLEIVLSYKNRPP